MTRWGILSTGRIAHQFARDFAHVQGGTILAVASRRQEDADRFAAQHGIGNALGSYEALFADPEVDVIYVATPHSLHLENCLSAVRHQKAVLCEKPLTTGPEDCEQLIAAARSENTYLLEAMWTHFLPAIRVALDWVREGKIGSLMHIKADFGYPLLPFDPERREYKVDLGGGALLEMGIYPIALAWLFTREDLVVQGQVVNRAPNGVEDDLVLVGTCGDVRVSLGTSFRCKLQNWAYLIGDRGYIAIPDFWRSKRCLRFELDTLVEEYCDDSPGAGFHHEASAVCTDLAQGASENAIVPLSTSLVWQRQIGRIIEKIRGA